LLFADREVKSLCLVGLQTNRIGKERFERNLRRLLEVYSVNLKKELQSREQLLAFTLVRSQSRYVSNKICRMASPQARADNMFSRLKSEPEPILEKFLKDIANDSSRPRISATQRRISQ
jgi:hypothetical protein